MTARLQRLRGGGGGGGSERAGLTREFVRRVIFAHIFPGVQTGKGLCAPTFPVASPVCLCTRNPCVTDREEGACAPNVTQPIYGAWGLVIYVGLGFELTTIVAKVCLLRFRSKYLHGIVQIPWCTDQRGVSPLPPLSPEPPHPPCRLPKQCGWVGLGSGVEGWAGPGGLQVPSSKTEIVGHSMVLFSPPSPLPATGCARLAWAICLWRMFLMCVAWKCPMAP